MDSLTRTTFLTAAALLLGAATHVPATDTYFGTKVMDTYRWLENPADPDVRAWSAAQDQAARSWLDAKPVRQRIADRLTSLLSQTSPSYSDVFQAGGHIFATYAQPPKQQTMIAELGLDADPSKARVVVDPNALDPTGSTEIDWFVPSPDGSKLAVSLSRNGSEDGTLHVFDVATGRDTGLVIPRVQYPTAGGSVAWRADSTGFYYTRYPGPERPAADQHFFQQVFYHRLGTDPASDIYTLGRNLPKVAEIALDTRQNPNYVLVTVGNGDGGQFEHFVIGPDGTPQQLTTFEDDIVGVAIGPDNFVYLTSRRDAPRGKLLRLPVGDLTLSKARVIVPQGAGVIPPPQEFQGPPVVVTRDALYIREMVGGPTVIAAYTHAGKPLKRPGLPPIADVPELDDLGNGTLLYNVATYLTPPHFLKFDEATGKTIGTKLAVKTDVHFDDARVVRIMAKSKDGTLIPLNIIEKKGTQADGKNPTLIYGYGGYGLSEVPHFLGARTRVWLDGGGVYAVANIRGGGEFGATWHDQGALTHKQNVFDDFAAAATWLVHAKITSPAHLAALGGSNGGLLMGAMITQHPDLFHAIVSDVGIYDMLRVELDPNGAFNTTEFGTVTDPAQFAALYAYSPYQHVVVGQKYPAIFMQTGSNDGRVNPLHSRKMIAALQAANAGPGPILLSINAHAGHGIGSALSVRIGQYADYLTFLYTELGMSLPQESSFK